MLVDMSGGIDKREFILILLVVVNLGADEILN